VNNTQVVKTLTVRGDFPGDQQMKLIENDRRPRLLTGIKQIAQFYGIAPAKANRLAASGILPGCFKLGRCWFLDEDVALEDISERARRWRLE
jgi:hypothetical protein